MLTLTIEISKDLEDFVQVDQSLSHNDQDNDINATIQELCEIFEDTGAIKFRVSGFGQDIWPVDVATDLASILEQIPESIYSLDQGNYPFSLDFYEQGIQRRLDFNENNGLIKISCYSGTSWTPHPASILMTKEDILLQLLNIKENFLQLVNKVAPNLLSSNLFTEWRNAS
ncbi:hypothetical protein [Synechococcus sp. PCC 6312]|uniref:hypothetical protein n=1 Tax=Synechococcus sp. (strain ATCC 27167 / PCC 6312) TaxID=195253 RepID=UPI00029EDA38|nr:hypothetical protein [Synechococcus sp. PCC 6312]AFY61913.1 hypothetical protein Syn6312_2843 [Synechococcus sp. PCC 6312]